MELTQEQLNDLNVIVHQKEWPSALKLFEIMADNKAAKMKTSELTNDQLRETLGEYRAYSNLKTLLFDTYSRLKSNGDIKNEL